MSDTRALKVVIGAGLDPKFKRAFQSADKQIRGLNQDIVDLKKKQALIKDFKLNTDDFNKAQAEIDETKARLVALQEKAKDSPFKNLDVEFKKARAEATKLQSAFNVDKLNLREAREQARLLRQEIKKTPTADLKKRLDDTRQSILQFERKVLDSKEAVDKANGSLKKIKGGLQIHAEVDKTTQTLDRMSGALDKKKNKLDQVQSELKEAGIRTQDYATDNDRLSRSLEKVTRRHERLTKLRAAKTRADQQFSDAKGKVVGAGLMGYGAVRTVGGTFNRQAQVADIAITAGLDDDQIALMKDKVASLTKDDKTLQRSGSLYQGINDMLTQGMEFSEVMQRLQAVGATATASGADISDMAKTTFSLKNNMNIAASESQKAFDMLVTGGKLGSFELDKMAQYFPSLTADAKKLGIEGVEGVATLTAALQISMNTAGDPAEAANNMKNFMAKITAPETLKNFTKRYKVNLEQEMKAAAGKGIDPMLFLVDRTMELTGGDEFRVGELFGDMQAKSFLTAMTQNQKKFQKFKQEIMGADGTVQADLQRRLELDPNLQMTQFMDSVGQLKNNVLVPLIPVMKKMVDGFNAVLEPVVAFTKANPELTKTIVTVAAGLFAFNLGAVATKVALSGAKSGVLGFLVNFLPFTGALKGGITLLGGFKKAVSAVAGSKRLASWLMISRGLVSGLAVGGFGKLRRFVFGASLALDFLTKRGLGLISRFALGAARFLPLVAGGIKAIGVAMLANPVGLTIAAVAIGAGLIYKNWDKIGPWFSEQWENISTGISEAWPKIKKSISEGIKSATQFLIDWHPLGLIIKKWGPITDYFKNVGKRIKDGFLSFFGFGSDESDATPDSPPAQAMKKISGLKGRGYANSREAIAVVDGAAMTGPPAPKRSGVFGRGPKRATVAAGLLAGTLAAPAAAQPELVKLQPVEHKKVVNVHQSMDGLTINVQGSPGDPHEQAAVIRDELERLQREQLNAGLYDHGGH